MLPTKPKQKYFTFIVTLAGVVLIILAAAFYTFNNYIYKQKQAYAAKDYKNAEYTIGDRRVRLLGGVSEIELEPGSASKVTTRYFGNELKTDLNSDGREDVVFLITQNMDGTGIFYHVVAALNNPQGDMDGYIGSESFFLGDRIAPQTTEKAIEKGSGNIIIVNYADRAPEDPFATPPSVNKSVWLLLDPQTMQFGTVEQNFEGESAEVAVASCDFGPSCKESVKVYILKNLAKLSPEKEVLGGKFYIGEFSVDEFTVRNDVVIDSFVKGQVTYSDGHNEFTARYSFKINPDMSLTFRTFDIVK
jgi:hypothetical protein